MKKSKLFISETYADQARAALRCDRLCSELTGVLLCCAGAVPAAVPAARAGARVPDPQAHLLDPRQDEEPRDQHAHQGPHQDRHALSARHRCRAAGCLWVAACGSRATRCCAAAAWQGAPRDLMLLLIL